MVSKFVDTNIFIEILMRKGRKSDRALKLLESDNPLWTTTLVFAEVEWVLRDWFECPKAEVVAHLKRILSYHNLEITERKRLIEAVTLYGAENIDWTDCFNLAVVQEKKQSAIYSFDKHFDKISGIKRLEP